MSHSNTVRLLERAQHGCTAAPLELFVQIRDRLQSATRGVPFADPVVPTRAHLQASYLKQIPMGARTSVGQAMFLAIGATAIRHLVVRDAQAQTDRGPIQRPLPSLTTVQRVLRAGTPLAPRHRAALLALDEALDRLERRWRQPAEVIEGRFFGQLRDHELALALGTSVATVQRSASLGMQWLRRDRRHHQPIRRRRPARTLP